MKQSINLYQFRQAFHDHDRGDQFTYEGLEVLFNSLEELADDTGTEVELDVIALCCEFSEDTPADIMENYGLTLANIDLDPLDSPDESEIENALIEYLNDHTFVCGATDSTIVYQAF